MQSAAIVCVGALVTLALGSDWTVAALDTALPAYIAAAVADGGRPASDTERDAERKPGATLTFAGVKPGAVVVELAPGRGYYTRLLSAVVGPKGKVYAVAAPRRPDAPADAVRGHTDQFILKFVKP